MTFIETSNLSDATRPWNGKPNPWTVERELEVRRLWKAGYSAGQIAVEMGGATRNAVIGKLHRLGLTSGDRAKGIEIKCLPGARTAGAKVQRRPDGFNFRRNPLPKEKRPLQQLFAAPAPDIALDIPPHQRVPLQALTDKSCRYPIGDPGQPDFGFCNGKHAPGLPYCSSHARIAYRRPS